MWSYFWDGVKMVMSVFVVAINGVLSILPEMTLEEPEFGGSWVGLLNYVVNIGLLLDTLAALIGMTLLWKFYKWLLKFVQ